MKKLLLITLLKILMFLNVNANWDLKISRNVPGKTTIKILTIPFEGLNRYTVNPNGNNRVAQIFVGPLHRRFVNENSFADSLILFHSTTNEYLYLSSCFAEVIMWSVYGFGKYLITFENFNNPNKNMSFILNTLDSKAGMDNVINGRPYHSDWSINYYDVIDSAFIEIDNGDTSINKYTDTICMNEQNKEITYWYAYWRNSVPLERKFYARTTPFPMNPYNIIGNNEYLHDIQIGTTVIFDTVYRNLGNNDRYGYNTVENNGPFNYYLNPPIPDYSLEKQGNTFTTPGHYYPGSIFGMKIKANNVDSIIIKKNKILYISGLGTEGYGDTLLLTYGSTLTKDTNAQLNACFGGVIIDSGSSSIWSNNSSQRIYSYSELTYAGLEHLINNGGYIQIDNYGKIRLEDNTTVTFDGEGTYLKLNQNSNVILGENTKIVFQNGAYLLADGATFSASNPNINWKGLVFENAGRQTEIRNCTFNNAIDPVKIYNNFYYSNYDKVIKNCTFNMPYSGNNSVYAENVGSILIQNNTFNFSANSYTNRGIFIKNTGFEPLPDTSESSPAENLILNILGNTFNGGKSHILISSNASLLTPVNILYNTFVGTSNTDFSIFAKKITGNIKNNSITNTNVNIPLRFDISNVNLLRNVIRGQNSNIIIATNSTVNMSPYKEGNTIIWYGGKNDLYSATRDNIEITSYISLLPMLDYGENCFGLGSSNNQYHIWANEIDTNISGYYIRKNDWSPGNSPIHWLRRQDETFIEPIFMPLVNCNPLIGNGTYELYGIGYDLYDTLFTTQSGSQYTAAEDEILHNEAELYLSDKLFLYAINKFKQLIDNYPGSQYLESDLYDMYSCYEKLDTSSNSAYRDNLYSNLKTYLTERIQSELYSEGFEDIAYQLILMCEANLENYNEALSGYEFISMYHPDPELRLLASWDFSEIENLINGGGSTTTYTIEQRIKKLEKSISSGSDTLMRLMKTSYNRVIEERIEKRINEKIKGDKIGTYEKMSKKEIKNLPRTEKINLAYNRDEKTIISRANENLNILKGMSKEAKEKKYIEDLYLISKIKSQVVSDNVKVEEPEEYILNQNYPNPFNPTTKINFALPKQGFVTMKVYDILGRVVRTLVNEYKNAGNYITEFDGTNLSSGVYFYKLTADNFSNVKKMILIK